MRRSFCICAFEIACALLFSHTSLAQWQFYPGPARPVAKGPAYIAAADFDDDGTPDVVVSSTVDPVVTVLFVRPDGDFQSVVNVVPSTQTNVGLRGLTAGDFYGHKTPDGNDINDIAVVDYTGARVFVIPGNGDGTFGTVPSQGVVTGIPKGVLDIAAGNLDGQVGVDLVTANGAANSITPVWSVPGAPISQTPFILKSPIPVDQNPSVIATADFNSDQMDDMAVLATGGSGANSLSVVLSNPVAAPTFVNYTVVNYTVGVNAVDVVVADFNSDGLPDIAVANQGANHNPSISILLNRTDKPGSFNVLSPITLDCPTQNGVAIPCSAQGITSADFDGDDRIDLAVSFSNTLTTPGFIRFYKGLGDGSFGFVTQVGVGNAPRRIIAADFTGDGVPDLAVTEFGSDTVRVLQGACNVPSLGCTPRPTNSPTPTQTLKGTSTPTGTKTATPTKTPTDLRTATQTPTPQPIGFPCTTPVQCSSPSICADGVCCSTDCSPPLICDHSLFLGTCHVRGANGDSCNANNDCTSNYCAANKHCATNPTPTTTSTTTRTTPLSTPTATATPTPKGSGISCTSACSGGLVCNTDVGVCCDFAPCPLLGQRCDIYGSIGTCSAALAAGASCVKPTDCQSGACVGTGPLLDILVCGPSLTPDTPTATPTKNQGSITSDTPGIQNAIATVTRSGGCSIGGRTDAGGAWMLVALPVAFWARRFRRQHAHALRRERPRVQ